MATLNYNQKMSNIKIEQPLLHVRTPIRLLRESTDGAVTKSTRVS